MPKLLIPEGKPTLDQVRAGMCAVMCNSSLCGDISLGKCRECIFNNHAPIEPFVEWLVKYVDENCKGSKDA